MTLIGPDGSAYKDGKFEIEVNIPSEYPLKPPVLKFITPIYHPNVDSNSGDICKDIYASDWTPVKRIISLIETIQGMLIAPNLSTPIENEIAKQY